MRERAVVREVTVLNILLFNI